MSEFIIKIFAFFEVALWVLVLILGQLAILAVILAVIGTPIAAFINWLKK